jgi:RNA polymerase-interacting CarD/CdnL/TRCF family regulator
MFDLKNQGILSGWPSLGLLLQSDVIALSVFNNEREGSMETQQSQNSSQNFSDRANSQNAALVAALASNSEIPVGSVVVYAMHGKCTISAVETRALAGETLRLYKLEVQKSALSRSTRQEPAIWVPVSSAKVRGIRSPMSTEDVEKAFQILSTREYYLSSNEAWHISQSKIEALVRTEGSIGIAKALSFLFVLKRKQVVPYPEVNRLNETIQKQFAKEISELTGETIKSIEERIAKAMKNKLLADQ